MLQQVEEVDRTRWRAPEAVTNESFEENIEGEGGGAEAGERAVWHGEADSAEGLDEGKDEHKIHGGVGAMQRQVEAGGVVHALVERLRVHKRERFAVPVCLEVERKENGAREREHRASRR